MANNDFNFDACSVSIPSECDVADTPRLFRGLVSDWPVVSKFREKHSSVLAYIASFDRGGPITVYQAGPEASGRVFYNDSFNGFNFERHRKKMTEIETLLNQYEETQNTDNLLYVGSTSIEHWFPGFEKQNHLDLGDREYLNSIWFGTRCLIAPHFDFPENLAVVVAGKRKFRLYPPEQIDNLYIGPFDLTPSGQPISLVDVRNPDYDKFPKFKEAEKHCIELLLEPGDAVFIPSMWWHSVESLDDFNVLVNYWWRTTPSYLGPPLAAFQMAMLCFDGLGHEQKKIWQNLFQKYVFERSDDAVEHIPDTLKGLYNGIDKQTAIRMRNNLSEIIKTK